jgi:hypothetical protein
MQHIFVCYVFLDDPVPQLGAIHKVHLHECSWDPPLALDAKDDRMYRPNIRCMPRPRK